jgi:hypothetical protein
MLNNVDNLRQTDFLEKDFFPEPGDLEEEFSFKPLMQMLEESLITTQHYL